MSPRCSGYSICQANLNDLVGSEMCHKAALMDEGEHGANDTATSPRPHSLLMKALTPETATFNVPPMGGGGAREEHREVFRWLPESALLTPKHLAGRTSRRREKTREPGSEKFKKMSAFFGGLIERMSNGV